MNSVAKFNFGKIKSKYLIIEILSYADYSDQAALYLLHSNQNMR